MIARTLLMSLALVVTSAVAAHGPALGTSAAIDRDGRVLVVYRENAGHDAYVILRRSGDRGASWSAPVRVNAKPEPVSADGENRPKIAVSPQGELYVSWTSPTSANYTGDIRFSRSLDKGATWSPPIVVHRNRALITHRFESLLVDGAGRLWAVWVDKRDLAQSPAAPMPVRRCTTRTPPIAAAPGRATTSSRTTAASAVASRSRSIRRAGPWRCGVTCSTAASATMRVPCSSLGGRPSSNA
jgi:hypothetical protein